jgi:mannose-1-phosphate guanylyltransferase/mannose-6-phosphate isomerase
MEIVPIILTGGLGKRLWPISRSQFPKQLTSLVGEQTMLQNTAERIKGLSNLGDEIIALCNEDHKFLVANQLSEVNIRNPSILVEPVSRNTAIAIFIASLQAVTNKDPKELVLLVLPSDHLIQDIEQFHLSINKASEVAMDGKLVTLGVTPNGPSTLYGYIKKSDNSEENYIPVEAFIEKPNLEKAEQFIADGSYLWNSGMFLFRADILQDELNRHSKESF